MQFDEHFIEEVRSRTGIVDLIGGYVQLKKSGKDFAALCPFHSEKTPSFLVSDSKQIFKCFGCGAGGDAFKFMMLIENLSFPESVLTLAQRAGVATPQDSSRSGPKAEKRQKLLEIMQHAQEFFASALENSPAGRGPAEYLSKRGIDGDTLERFSLGYAPPGNLLTRHLTEKGVTQRDSLLCGLLAENQSGSYYDKFRNRIMFPIRNLSGQTIAFGGRILGQGVPKYLNSPETPLYNKSSHLFALDLARDQIRRAGFAILVEGYFDCIVPFQFGLRNVVASLGTSLTRKQVQTLGRYARNVIINFDRDSAGTAATLRSIDLFLEERIRVNIVQLPEGEDPDSYVRREGMETYRQQLQASVPYLDFALTRFIAEQKSPSSPKGKQEIATAILPYLAKVSSPIEQVEYVSRVAHRLGLEEKLLLAELGRMRRGKKKQPPSLLPTIRRLTLAEEVLLAALLDDRWQATVLQDLPLETFESLGSQPIFQAASQLKQQEAAITITNLEKSLEDEEAVHLLQRSALQPPRFPLSKDIIKESLLALQKKYYEWVSRQIQEEIGLQEREGGPSSQLDELLVRKEKIRKRIELDRQW